MTGVKFCEGINMRHPLHVVVMLKCGCAVIMIMNDTTGH
jgi:hypothetical protein